uniref:Uncharacterized protein n=1 Tax=Steinernema glaseri TaxID=37863 RepID=A0A1I7YVI4_9BILA
MIRPNCSAIALFVLLLHIFRDYKLAVDEYESGLMIKSIFPVVFQGAFPLMIYSAYYHYLPHQGIGFTLIGYSYCRTEEESTRLEIGNIIFPLKSVPLLADCPGHTGCDIGPYRLSTEIPTNVALPETAKLVTEKTSTTIPVQTMLLVQRTTGFVACVSPIYWFNNWVRVIEFVEIYR